MLTNNRSPIRQRGYATLVISMVILVMLTLMTLYAGRVGVMEQKTSANYVRASESQLAAENAIELGIGYLSESVDLQALTWTDCTGVTTVPCGDGASNIYGAGYIHIANITPDANNPPPALGSGLTTYQLHFVTRENNNGAIALKPYPRPVINMVAEGIGADNSARALIKQSVNYYKQTTGTVAAPLIAAGTISKPGAGNFSVVVNPNGGGPGVPLSTWAGSDAFAAGGSWASCHIHEFLDDASPSGTDSYPDPLTGETHTLTRCTACNCPAADALSDASIENYDILDVDSNTGVNPDTIFPADLFQYVFGIPRSQYLTIYDKADKSGTCNGLDASSNGLFWIEGECDFGNVSQVGSFEKPVLIVATDGFAGNGNPEIFGLLFAFDPTVPSGSSTFNVKLNGGATVYGAVISDQQINFSNGNFKMRYDQQVLDAIGKFPTSSGLGKLPGTWSDYY